MKRIVIALVTLCLMCSSAGNSFAQESPQAYMELSATSPWSIFTKNMDDKELLEAVGKSSEEINEILKSTDSESLIINRETGAQIYLSVKKNDLSYELWNIADLDNDYITKNLNSLVYDGFMMESLNYKDEDVLINDYAYMKLVTVSGSAYFDGLVHGVICSGTCVNGYSIVFTMISEGDKPTEEEISEVNDIASSVSFTVIKDKETEPLAQEPEREEDVFNYILGGFAALVVVIFCGYMIMRMKNKGEEDEE